MKDAADVITVLETARNALFHGLEDSGKRQHHCDLCRLSGVHPCPVRKAMIALFEADSIARAELKKRGSETSA